MSEFWFVRNFSSLNSLNAGLPFLLFLIQHGVRWELTGAQAPNVIEIEDLKEISSDIKEGQVKWMWVLFSGEGVYKHYVAKELNKKKNFTGRIQEIMPNVYLTDGKFLTILKYV